MSVNIPNSMLAIGKFSFTITVRDLPSRMQIKFLREARTGLIYSNGNLSRLARALRKDAKLPYLHITGGEYPTCAWSNVPPDSNVWYELDKLPAIVALGGDRMADGYRKQYAAKELKHLEDRVSAMSCHYLALGAVDLFKHIKTVDFPILDIHDGTVITLNENYF